MLKRRLRGPSIPERAHALPDRLLRLSESSIGCDLGAILGFVIIAISEISDLLNPRSILAIPVDCLFESGGPRFARPPSELSFRERWIDRITPIVSQAIFDKLNQGARLAQRVEQGFCYFEVASFVASADVVDGAGSTVFQSRKNRTAMVLHIDPITH